MCNAFTANSIHLCIVKINSHLSRQLRALKLRKMNTTKVKGNWIEQKGKLKQKFGFLTDNDLMFEEGKKEEMLGTLQIKLG